jgi:Cu(I)/Ag(I) efflux system membrane fusion protein
MKRWIVPAVLVAVVVVAGLAFHRDLIEWFSGERKGATSAAVRTQAGELTIEVGLRPDPPREKGNTLVITATDGTGKPVDGAAVTVAHVMPAMGSMPEMRGTSSVAAKGGGRYEARFDLAMAGSWTLDVRVNAASARFQMTVGTPGLRSLGGSSVTKPAEIEEPSVPPTEFPVAAIDALRRAFDASERLRAELAADRVDGLAGPAREVAQAIRAAEAATPGAGSEVTSCIAHGVSAAESLASAKDLENARLAYGELNRYLIALAAADPRLQSGWHVFSCPMAKGFKKWIQQSPTLENPYMGQAMLSCGSVGTWGVARSDDGPAVSHDGHGHTGDDVSHYTCSMHPSVRKDGPGTCPICSMNLSPVTFDEEESGVIMIDEGRRAQVGIRTGKVVKSPMTRSLRAVGRVAYDESRLRDVTLKLGGWITKLHVERTGQPVKQGQLLFTLYSPELYAAQQEYLLAKSAHSDGGRGEYLAKAAEKKLQLWGMTAAQIAALATRGEAQENMPFYSPASGYVIEKDVVEGGAVEAGQRLFRIAALDRVWVEAELYEADLAIVSKGQRATISLSYLPDKTYDGTVSYVFPYLDPASRTARVRVELPNKGLELKPDMYATVAFQIDLGARLQVPIDAVVYTGPRRLVFVDMGEGRLRPVEVTLGVRTDDAVEVKSGLNEGDVVVTSGNFLVAAESRIRSAAKIWSEERAGGSP